MTELVLDASVVAKWFRTQGEGDVAAARALKNAFQDGTLVVAAPSLLNLELLNVAGRRWGWGKDRLVRLARALKDLGFELIEPDLDLVATWTGAGLTAYDAAYVALAEATGRSLVTADGFIVDVAPAVAKHLSAWT